MTLKQCNLPTNKQGHLGGVGEINAGAFEPGGFANKQKEEILK
ncbi:hypothetical protein ACWHAM_20100 [Paenibacillus terrae]|uniref:Uncharacterized protein n=1 Tax=Paenibacillus terrae (strain HPL-003) TaxID=985665 RepID=G7VSG9_PAETH|nr:hypothetical protein HPL003_27330 [Paenibacillus terrae HPL-003]